MTQRNPHRRGKPKHKKRKPRETATDILLQRVRESEHFKDHGVLIETPGLVRMSRVLLDFAKPYIDPYDDHDLKRAIMSLAIIAWNISLLPQLGTEENLVKLITPVLGSKPSATHLAEHNKQLRGMVAHKERFFPQYDRVIFDYEIKFVGEEMRLAVVSKPLAEHEEK